MHEITYNGLHTWRDLGAVMSGRKIGQPPRHRITEQVPYSNITEDFTAIYGVQTYGERALEYRFTLLAAAPAQLERRMREFVGRIYGAPPGRQALYDDRVEGYHFSAVCTELSEPTYISSTAAVYTVRFAAAPYLVSDVPAFLPDEERFPDINGDGRVNANDAAMILRAAANIGAKRPSGLTPEQEKRADADRDGRITANDAAIVERFAAACGARRYENSVQGWTDYLNDTHAQEEGVL